MVSTLEFTDGELAQKFKAEKRLIDYMSYAWRIVDSVPFKRTRVVEDICYHLEAVTSGEIKNLLINVPPGFSKSFSCSVMWPTWEWGPHGLPHTKWQHFSYAERLAIRDSLRCRKLISSEWYQRFWGEQFHFSADQNTKTRFANNHGGERALSTPAGVATGEHPDRVVCDDPHNVRQAESDAERESVIDWWTLTMPLRGITRNVATVIVMQRLHELDLSGWVISNELEEQNWVHLCYPMHFDSHHPFISYSRTRDWRTEEGELLAPDYMTEAMIKHAGKRLGEYGRAGQFEQRPAPRSGGMFKRFEDIKPGHLPTEFDALVRYWDRAASDKEGDWSVGVLMARKGNRAYVIDVIREQSSAAVIEKRIEQTARTDNLKWGHRVSTWVEQEGGASGKGEAERTVERLPGLRVRAERPSTKKTARAERYAIAAENGEVFVVIADWSAEFLSEHRVFDKGAHDDQVDASSGAYRKLFRPDKILIGYDEIEACCTLTKPPEHKANPYSMFVSAVHIGERRQTAGFCAMGIDPTTRHIALVHNRAWSKEGIGGHAISEDEIVREVAEFKLKWDPGVLACAYVPSHADSLADKIVGAGMPTTATPLDTKNRKFLAQSLIDVFAAKRIDICPKDNEDLLGTVANIAITQKTDGFRLEDDFSDGINDGLALSFAMSTMWADGTLTESLM